MATRSWLLAATARRPSSRGRSRISSSANALPLSCAPATAKPSARSSRQPMMPGIPVFTADIKCLVEDADVICHIATDNHQGGREAGKAMIEALGDKGGKIAILDFPVVESCQLRTKGFKEVLSAHNSSRDTGQIT